MRIMIAGGGSGGHIYPALAVVSSLRARAPGVELGWIGGRRGLEGQLVPPTGIRLQRLVLRSLRSTDLSIHAVLDPLRLALSVPQALVILARHRPDAVFTTGGYVALPVIAAAAALRIPSLVWEGNVVPGRSTRLAARWATLVSVSFAATARAFGPACRVTGTPIRSLAGIEPAAAREHLGIPAGPPVLLLFGGSQAVRRFDAAVDEALPALVGQAAVVHLTGETGYEAAQRRQAALPAADRGRYRPFASLGAEMADALVAADIIVGRAGSSTLAEAMAAGRPMIVVPYPHAAGHQRANARLLAEAGAGRVVADEDFDGAALLRAADLLADAQGLARMAAASRGLGRPGAAGAIAELLLALAEGRTPPDAAAVERLALGAA